MGGGGAKSKPFFFSHTCYKTVQHCEKRQRRLDDIRELSLSDRWCPNLADAEQINWTNIASADATNCNNHIANIDKIR